MEELGVLEKIGNYMSSVISCGKIKMVKQCRREPCRKTDYSGHSRARRHIIDARSIRLGKRDYESAFFHEKQIERLPLGDSETCETLNPDLGHLRSS